MSHTIGPDTPLMEAVQLMDSSGMINLPVMAGPELLGILRDKDILLEIAQHLGLD